MNVAWRKSFAAAGPSVHVTARPNRGATICDDASPAATYVPFRQLRRPPARALLGGALGTAIGLQTTLWIGVLGALGGVVWLFFPPIPRLREAPAEAE